MVSYVFDSREAFVGFLQGMAAKTEGRAEAKDSQKDKSNLRGQAIAFRDIADMFENTYFKDTDSLKAG